MCKPVGGTLNDVGIQGIMDGEFNFYFAKGAPRFEFLLRHVSEWGTVHKFTVQSRGWRAYIDFLNAMEGRGVQIEGRLKSRGSGRVCIVSNQTSFQDPPRRLTADDLITKVMAIKSIENTPKDTPITAPRTEEMKEDEPSSILPKNVPVPTKESDQIDEIRLEESDEIDSWNESRGDERAIGSEDRY